MCGTPQLASAPHVPDWKSGQSGDGDRCVADELRALVAVCDQRRRIDVSTEGVLTRIGEAFVL